MTKRPNILLITTDQHHFDALGKCDPVLETPNLDRLCDAGIRFDRAYCPSPVCTPSRASIITGQYPSHHGAFTIGVRLDEKVPTVGAALSKAGYATGLVGKAHFQPLGGDSLEKQPVLRALDFWRGFSGPWYGFDHIELLRNHADESHVGQHYAIWLEEQGLADWREYFKPLPGEKSSKTGSPDGDPRHWQLPEDLHYTPWVAERSIAFIEDCVTSKRPFFLWTSFPDPHPPYTISEPWASMYDPADMEVGVVDVDEHTRNPKHFGMTQTADPDFTAWHQPFNAHGCKSHLHTEEDLKKDKAIYYGMISFMDREIGRMLDYLDAKGLTEDTLIVFTTDHGHFLGQHGLIAKGPFHYEDMIRIPFIVSQPGTVPEGMVSSAMQSLVDLAPTFLDAAGLSAQGDMQGISQLGVWTGGARAARDFVLCENRHNPEAPHAMSYVADRYKITVYRHGKDGEIFDLEADPNELNNLWYDTENTALKADLLLALSQGVMRSEPTKSPRVANA